MSDEVEERLAFRTALNQLAVERLHEEAGKSKSRQENERAVQLRNTYLQLCFDFPLVTAEQVNELARYFNSLSAANLGRELDDTNGTGTVQLRLTWRFLCGVQALGSQGGSMLNV